MPKSRWVDIDNNTFALAGGSNIGFIVHRNRALMVDAWLAALASMPELPYDTFVAGHGEPVADVAPLVHATAARLREIRSATRAALAEPREPYAVLRAVAAHFGVTFAAPQFFLLSLTTINAAFTSLQRAGEAEITVVDNRLLWRTCS